MAFGYNQEADVKTIHQISQPSNMPIGGFSEYFTAHSAVNF